MAEYCTHYVESGQEAFYVGNKLRDNSSSHIGDVPNECGQEINEIPYCDFHNAQYTDEELADG
jgi:hypothetical protein